jgi:hypothetical protein
MHYHLEVIIPPTDDIEGAVQSVLAQFNENADDDEYDTRHAFWDWYVIGGRWAGAKAKSRLDPEKLEQFYAWLQDEKVTVSGFTAGKQSLEPKDQIPKVDAKWNEMFPPEDGVPVACPLFDHASNKYGKGLSGTLNGDIGTLKDSLEASCSRVIFSGPRFNSKDSEKDFPWTGPLEAKFMLSDDIWNGVNHVPVNWDGKIGSALRSYSDSIKGYKDAYAAAMTPQDDWLVITVDYHS